MKKTILIVAGILFLLTIIGVWIYLFVFGAPQNANDVFTNFGITGTDRTDSGFEEQPFVVDTEPETANGTPQTLRQLTTRPVAGMTFLEGNVVRYVERGTGHIYDISLDTGSETQVTNTTHTHVTDAHISSSGNRVILTTTATDNKRVRVGSIVKNDEGAEVLDSLLLPEGASEAGFSSDESEVLYMLKTDSGAEAHAYTFVDGNDRILFTVPFSELRVLWGNPTYIYTKPTAALTGYVYEVANGELQYVRSGGRGLSVFKYEDGFITTEDLDAETLTIVYDSEFTYQMRIPIYPEKCTGMPEGNLELLCAAPLEQTLGTAYPDDWYKGVVTFQDILWGIDVEAESATVLADPFIETGRVIDVAHVTTNSDGTQFLLINKNDGALWLFEPQL